MSLEWFAQGGFFWWIGLLKEGISRKLCVLTVIEHPHQTTLHVNALQPYEKSINPPIFHTFPSIKFQLLQH